MTPADLGFRLLSLVPGVPDAAARKFAGWAFAVGCVLAVLLALAAWRWVIWPAFDWFNDREAVEDAANEANSQFREDLDQATGDADVASQGRREQFEARQRTTEELIDEAERKGCAVADYLASDGAVCLRGSAGGVPDAAP